MAAYTHRRYFERYALSVDQYGEILVTQAFSGKKMGHAQKCYDVVTSKSKFAHALHDIPNHGHLLAPTGIEEVRIQVRSKSSETLGGTASVVHCKDSDLSDGGMTHLAIVLVETAPRIEHRGGTEEGKIVRAWLMTRDGAAKLREKKCAVQYIAVSQLKANPSDVIDITRILSGIADAPLDSED